MQFLILRKLTQSELGWFAEYRRQGKETSKQRAINFDSLVVDRVFPASARSEVIPIKLRYRGDSGLQAREQCLKHQQKNWRLTGDRIADRKFGVVRPGDLFVSYLDVASGQPSGTFDIYSEGSSIYRRLLSSPETNGLVKGGMIALDMIEAQQLLSVLNETDPDLFPIVFEAKTPGKENEVMTNDKKKTHKVPPNPARTMSIMANLGHSLNVAVADLIDNSIAAGATEVQLHFPPPDGEGGRHLAIADNGEGMTNKVLLEAMTVGSRRSYENNELGKYGVGMKAASLSQAKILTVCSKTKDTSPEVLRWDLDLISKEDEWLVVEPELEDWEAELLVDPLPDHGTVVLWSDMRPPRAGKRKKGSEAGTAYGIELAELAMHLEMVFHKFLEGEARGYPKLSIQLNGTELTPWDPFMTSHEDTRTLNGFSVPVMSADGKEYHVTVRPYVLPARSQLSEQEQQRFGHTEGWNKMQGFYVYRADRLIHAGDWCGLWVLDEHLKLARIAIDFDPVLDEAFEVNAPKMEVKFPAVLGESLKTGLREARKEARSTYSNANRAGKAKTTKKKAAAENIKPTPRNRGGDDSPSGSEAPNTIKGSHQGGQSTFNFSGHDLELKNMGDTVVWRSRTDLQGNEIVTLNADYGFTKALFEELSKSQEGQRAVSTMLSLIEAASDNPEKLQQKLALLISEEGD